MSSQIEAVREYYRRADAGASNLLDLFTPDFSFYYPKYGLGCGPADFSEFARGLLSSARSIVHPPESLRFIEHGSTVVVEGLIDGQLHSGETWKGGHTPTGRFCSVFDFEDGLIRRMHIYVDPDYGSLNKAGFFWGVQRKW